MLILHLMTQRDQPYGSVRRCCEECGLMMVARPAEFWKQHTWTDEPKHFESQTGPDGTELVTCTSQAAKQGVNHG